MTVSWFVNKVAWITKTVSNFPEVNAELTLENIDEKIHSSTDLSSNFKEIVSEIQKLNDNESLKTILLKENKQTTVLRVIIYFSCPALRPDIQALAPEFPFRNFKTEKSVMTLIKDSCDFGVLEFTKDRVIVTGHQGSGKTSFSGCLQTFLVSGLS